MNARQRRKAVRAWFRRATRHAFPGLADEPVTLTTRELLALSDYSLTIPTRTKPGLAWRANVVQFCRHCYAYQAPGDRAGFLARLSPPRWLRAAWVRGTVLEERHPEGGNVIRWEPIRVVR